MTIDNTIRILCIECNTWQPAPSWYLNQLCQGSQDFTPDIACDNCAKKHFWTWACEHRTEISSDLAERIADSIDTVLGEICPACEEQAEKAQLDAAEKWTECQYCTVSISCAAECSNCITWQANTQTGYTCACGKPANLLYSGGILACSDECESQVMSEPVDDDRITDASEERACIAAEARREALYDKHLAGMRKDLNLKTDVPEAVVLMVDLVRQVLRLSKRGLMPKEEGHLIYRWVRVYRMVKAGRKFIDSHVTVTGAVLDTQTRLEAKLDQLYQELDGMTIPF